MVGEQPGDIEDREGHPFVGPAGRVLHAAMASAGYGPEDAYLTNAVKHFKWEAKGARRLHKRPTFREATACYPWLASEIENVAPRVIVCLGSTAAQILISKDFKVTEGRGKLMSHKSGHHLVVTLHPSVILRARDTESRELDRRHLIEDLKLALSAANSL